jgi:dTDP-4-amino-4,6-dideoxygalactose transaminase
VPNFWLSCLLLDEDAMCGMTRTDKAYTYTPEAGKSCPHEILDALQTLGAEGRPIWKPMHMQPIYRGHAFVSAADGADVGADIFRRGLCLPSDNKMTADQQERIIETIRCCFD